MRTKYGIAALVFALASVSSVAAYAGTSSKSTAKIDKSKPPVTIALITLKVPGSDLLTGYNAGAQAAVKQINAQGGFGGRKAVIVSCNTMLQASVAATCAHQTLARHPVVMFGCEPSWGQSGLPFYAAAKVPTFNCMNTATDFHNPWSFGLQAGGFGLQGAMARYLCTRADVKSVVMFALDVPVYRGTAKVATGQPLAKCGKTVHYVFIPFNAADVSPYVDKAVSFKPDFVTLFPLAGAGAIPIYKSFAQNNIPASRTIISESNLTPATFKAAGALMEGAYGADQWASWSDTSNPDVAAYLRAMKGSSADPRDSNAELGYANVRFQYNVAKKIGFANFDSASLAKFMRDKQNNGFPIPLSRSLVIPGPKGYPQQRQPYGQITQWKNGKLNVVTKGTDKGWVSGF
jgi:ABC-type branched-subunit amino acid transport system substrate-binding protein